MTVDRARGRARASPSSCRPTTKAERRSLALVDGSNPVRLARYKAGADADTLRRIRIISFHCANQPTVGRREQDRNIVVGNPIADRMIRVEVDVREQLFSAK